MPDLYVTPSEVLAAIGGPNQAKPSEGAITSFLNEAIAIVQGRIGTLPTDPRDEEVAGVVRDMAAARALYLMRAAQTNERPRAAAWLMEDAMDRLQKVDDRVASSGLGGEVDEDAYVNFQASNLFELEDVGLAYTNDLEDITES